MKNSWWHYLILMLVAVLAIYIYIALGKLEAFAQQSANRHDGKQDMVAIIFIVSGFVGSIIAGIMALRKKFVLVLAALILPSVAFYGYQVLDKIECAVCARA